MATTGPFFPDLSVRLHDHGDEPVQFELHTFDPDADDDGKARDFGVSVIEGGEFVSDGSKDGYDLAKIRQLASLLEHAPDLYSFVRTVVTVAHTGAQIPEATVAWGQQLLTQIAACDLKYGR